MKPLFVSVMLLAVSAVNILPGSTAQAQNSPNTSQSKKFWCDQSSSTPVTFIMTKSGKEERLIAWSSTWAPQPYSPQERCKQVSGRMQKLHQRFGRIPIMTAGEINNLPVICAAENRDDAGRGICAEEGLIITATDKEDSVKGLFALGELFQAIGSNSKVVQSSTNTSPFPNPTPIKTNPLIRIQQKPPNSSLTVPYLEVSEN